MTRYYFDFHDGDSFVPDDTGIECAVRSDVRKAAISALPDLAREMLPDGDDHKFSVKVRDEQGRYVFQAVLILTAGWIE